jgi:hypothetical protein
MARAMPSSFRQTSVTRPRCSWAMGPDVGGGKLVVTLTDPDGDVFGLSQEP